jgi:hypothetical protein
MRSRPITPGVCRSPNKQFREAGGSYEEYGAAVTAAIAHGWLTMHPSGGYQTFTQAGADLFA